MSGITRPTSRRFLEDMHLQQLRCENLASHYDFFEVRDNWKAHELSAETRSFRISLCQYRKNFINSQKGNLRGICFTNVLLNCTRSDKKGKFRTVEGK
jgi:hypothetical protein